MALRTPTPPRALYDPAQERDACGVAFVADLHGRRSHDVVAKGLSALIRLDHRGARGAEHNTGDGAGIMIQVPDAFYRVGRSTSSCRRPATTPPAWSSCPNDPTRPPARAVKIFEKYALVEGGEVLGWRDVPVDPSGLGATADGGPPAIRQVFLAAHRLTDAPAGKAGEPLSGLDLDRVAFCIRKQAERETSQRGVAAYFPSLSARTITYKGMLTPGPAAGVLPGPDRRARGQRDRAGALPVLDEHVPVLAAGPPVPVHRAQR